MDDEKTTDELLEDAIRDAFDRLKIDYTEENLKAVETLIKLETDKDRVRNDYYVRATAADNETQKLVDEDNRFKAELDILNILKKAIPEFIKLGISSTMMLIFLGVVKKYEKDGYLVKPGPVEIGSKMLNLLMLNR